MEELKPLEGIIKKGAGLFGRWAHKELEKRGLFVHRIESSTDDFCEDTFRLLNETFGAALMEPVDRMFAWLNREQTGGGDYRPYLLIMKRANDPVAVISFTYYPRSRMGFIGYVVRKKEDNTKHRGQITKAFLSWLLSEMEPDQPLEHCRGVIFEMEDPAAVRGRTDDDIEHIEKEINDQRLTFRVLNQALQAHHLAARQLDVKYIQPSLASPTVEYAAAREVPLCLMYVDPNWAKKGRIPNTISEQEMIEIAHFLYDNFFRRPCVETKNPTEKEHVSAYVARLETLRDTMIRNLQPQTRLLSELSFTPI